MSRVFISYSRRDEPTAERLYCDLRNAGHQPWMDTQDLLAGDNWRDRIVWQIRESDYFLALLSRQSLSKRGYVQDEIRTALEVLREIPPDGRFVIPVRIEDCHPRELRLADINWVDLFPEYQVGLDRILAAIREGAAVPCATLFGDAAVSIPVDVAKWSDQRLFDFIEKVLWLEAINRAERDYEGVDIPDRDTTLRSRAREKLVEVATRHGFADRLESYWRRNR